MRISDSKIFGLLCLLTLCLSGCFWDGTESDSDFLPMNDSEYPYAGLPRVVIEVSDFGGIRDTKTELDSRLQIYGDSTPISEVYRLTVRGRGNSSAKMPKYGIRLEFEDKVSLFGMPKSRDWALIANFGDKTHLRNYMMTRISEWLGAKWTPEMHFVEVYLNRKYMGLYLLAETVKVAKKRVNILENDTTFLFEKEDLNKLDPPYIITNRNTPFHIKSPKNLSDSSANLLLNHLNDFETFIYDGNFGDPSQIENWLDLHDFALYYWVQEFSKNEDGGFGRSIFLTWEKGGTIHFGPLWDFDLAFGNASREENKPAENWYVRTQRWNRVIFNDVLVQSVAKDFWRENRNLFKDLIDSVPVYRSIIEKAVKNEFKRWPVMSNTENWALKDPYGSYDEAVETMVEWMKKRYDWIDAQYEN